MLVNTYSSRHTTDNEYPIIFSGFDCHGTGSKTKLASCGSGLNSNIQYCTNNVIEIHCEG